MLHDSLQLQQDGLIELAKIEFTPTNKGELEGSFRYLPLANPISLKPRLQMPC